MVFLNYKSQLKAYTKKQFDPFCRRERINFFYDTDDSNKYIETTSAVNVLLVILARQLYFHFRFDTADWAVADTRLRRNLETVAVALLIMVCVYMRGPGSAFIYFQF